VTKTTGKNFIGGHISALKLATRQKEQYGEKCTDASGHATISAVRWFLILMVPAVLLGRGHAVPSLVWYAGIIAVCYVFSLALHSNRRCRTCRGSGRQRAAMFPWADRVCTSCGGASRHRRWGVQLFYSGNRTYAEKSAAKARIRRARPR
jgi:hypothetical protein